MERCRNCKTGELVYDGFNDTWGCCECGAEYSNNNGPDVELEMEDDTDYVSEP